jgi:5-methylcytosine-specific restriction protein A
MSQGRRSQPLPADWTKTRARILARDGHRCAMCGSRATDVDHIVPVSQGGSEVDSNLQSLCRTHHASKTGREARAMRPSRKRPPETHPRLRL